MKSAVMKDMINENIFFCDTYALIEILRGNGGYQSFRDKILITSDLNLMELYYSYLRTNGAEIAKRALGFWKDFALTIPIETIEPAMRFKLLNKKDDLSYIDCMGYVYSLENNIKFLTGDMKFKDIFGVEYIK